MTSVRERIWWNLATRPILGLLLRERYIDPLPGARPYTPPQPVFHVVKHKRTGLYWRNPWPHQLISTPEWGKINQAYRFHSYEYAYQTMVGESVHATVVSVPVPAKTVNP